MLHPDNRAPSFIFKQMSANAPFGRIVFEKVAISKIRKDQNFKFSPLA